jgi:3-oxoacyl-[acyl-carrier-protein] synthase II
MNSDIVATGMGIICPLGCGVKPVWQRLLEGQSGLGLIDRFSTEDFPIKIAGQVPSADQDPEAGLDPDSVVDKKGRKKLDLFSLYALAAAEEALQQANWLPESQEDKQATATIIASGIGGLPTITSAQHTLDTRGHRRLSPFTAPAFLANMAAGNVSIKYGLQGPTGCPVTACAASLQAIGDGMRLIHSGEAEVALVGGSEACIDYLSLASFHALKALSTESENPQAASRPFDQSRNGFVMGEGAGLMVIETLEHALARGAKPLVRISGYGTTADAFHMTAGREDGAGAANAMQRALKAADLRPPQIAYINAHATSTPVGDAAEVAALRQTFNPQLAEIPISSTKSATGHILGGTGGVEAIFTACAVMHNALPPTINLHTPDENMADLDFVAGGSRDHFIPHAMCNGFGFGGVNASLILSKVE